jgi:sigma-E factor negative regulatory protein RseA
MDGELDKQDASSIIEVLIRNDDLQEEWKTYHLIGDALRHSSRLSINISSGVNQRLEIEPTVFSPYTSDIPKQQKYKVFAFAMAASVIAMISGWVIMHDLYEPRQIIVAEHSNNNSNLNAASMMVLSPTSVRNYPYSPVEMNDYLFVHREFSPGTAMRGQVTNVHAVTEFHERYGR